MMKKIDIFLILVTLFLTLNSQAQGLKPGPWRFELQTDYASIPFIIDFKWNKKRLIGNLHNGNETIKLKDIIYAGKKLTIPLETYEVTLELEEKDEKTLSGYLIRHNKNPIVKTPIIGVFGSNERFPGDKSARTFDLEGKWSVSLTDEEGKESPGVAVFHQKDNYITGSILTPTGDYRYFEGFISGEEFQAASFDGVFNYLLKGGVKKGKLQAAMLSNTQTKINGELNPKAELPNAYQQTQVSSLDFKFPNPKGKVISLSDPKFKHKPVIIQFFGSWCPNCMDEMNFLIPWYKENSKRNIEIIALAFERSLGYADAIRQINKVIKKKSVPYTVLIAGSTSEDKPMDKIKGMQNFVSFPTTVFLNKNHEVVKVHAGFTGPGTGEFFEQWKKEFETTVDGLLK